MSLVKLFTASTISRLDFSLIFRLTYWFKIFLNYNRSIKEENRIKFNGVTEIFSNTEE